MNSGAFTAKEHQDASLHHKWMIDILIDTPVVFQIRVFCNLLVQELSQTLHIIHMTKSQSVSRIVKSYPPPPQFWCLQHSNILNTTLPIQKMQCTSISCEWSITKAWLKMSLKKKTVKMKNLLQNHWFFFGKYIFLSHNSYNIPQTILFNIPISDFKLSAY